VAKFTIITPVFNGSRYIEETVRSVLDVTDGLDFEYLIIDDGSTDETKQILSHYRSKIVYIYQDNSGQASAINNGIKLASGKYSTIVNADDPLLSKDLFLQAELILDAEEAVVATYPDWKIIDAEGSTLETVAVKEFSFIDFVGKFNCLIGPGGIFRTEIARKVNGWDPSYKFVPDYDFWLRISDYGVFKHVPQVQATWRSHETSISVASRSKEMADERIRVIRKYLDRKPETSNEIKNMAIAFSNYRASVLSYFDSKINGRQMLFKAIRHYPKILLEIDVRVTLYVMFLPLTRWFLKFLTRWSVYQKLEEKIRQGIKS
jgi:glycosyltransferase involved in cell wall biosynthesis